MRGRAGHGRVLIDNATLDCPTALSDSALLIRPARLFLQTPIAITNAKTTTGSKKQLDDLLIEFLVGWHQIEREQEERSNPNKDVSHRVTSASRGVLKRSLIFLSGVFQSFMNVLFIDLFKQWIAGGTNRARNNLLELLYYFGCRKGSPWYRLFRRFLSFALGHLFRR